MRTRLQSGLIMLLALFLLGTAAQSAVCQTVCGMQVALPGCHSTALQSQQSLQATAGMEHCTNPSRTQSGDTVGVCHHRACEHPPMVGLVKASTLDVHVLPEVLRADPAFPLTVASPARRLPTGRAPPLRLASIDPLVLSLRV